MKYDQYLNNHQTVYIPVCHEKEITDPITFG